MNIAIVDDLSLDREHLVSLLKDYAAIHQLDVEFSEYGSAEEFLADFGPLRYTIIFLDIYMDGADGIEAAEKIRGEDDDVLLVFVTSSHDHAAPAMHFFASSYIMKPCEREDLYRAMDHILKLKTERDEKRFSFVADRKEQCVRYADLVSLESQGNYLMLTEKAGHAYRCRMTLGAAKEALDERFLLILKGILVNMDYITQMTENTCVMADGRSFPINVRKHREIQQVWQNHMFMKARRDRGARGVKQC